MSFRKWAVCWVKRQSVTAVGRVTRHAKFSRTAISQLLGKSPALSIHRRAHHGVVRTDRSLNCDIRAGHVIVPRRITLLSGRGSSRTLQSSCFASLHSTLRYGTRRRHVRVAIFRGLSSVVTHDSGFSKFVTVNTSRVDRRSLRQLRETVPCNIFVSIGPTPGLFSSIRPSLRRAVRSTITTYTTGNVGHIKFVKNGNYLVGFCRISRRGHTACFHHRTEHFNVRSSKLICSSNLFAIDGNHTLKRRFIHSRGNILPSTIVMTTSIVTINILRTFGTINILIPHSVDIVDVGGRAVSRLASPPLDAFSVSRGRLTHITALVLNSTVSNGHAVHRRTCLSASLIIHSDFIPTG